MAIKPSLKTSSERERNRIKERERERERERAGNRGRAGTCYGVPITRTLRERAGIFSLFALASSSGPKGEWG